MTIATLVKPPPIALNDPGWHEPGLRSWLPAAEGASAAIRTARPELDAG